MPAWDPNVPPTASKYWLARLCLHPWTSGLRWESRKASWARRLGSYAHRKLECLVENRPDNTGNGSSYVATPRMRFLAERCTDSGGLYLATLNGATARAEVAFCAAETVVNSDSGTGATPNAVAATEVFLGSARAYPPLPGLFGTADLVASSPRNLLVADWKTGLSTEPYTSHAKWQVRWLGVAAALSQPPAEPVELVITDAVYLKKDGSRPWVQREVWDTASGEWKELVGDVERTVKRLAGPAEGPRPGPHCKLCPVRGVCSEALL